MNKLTSFMAVLMAATAAVGAGVPAFSVDCDEPNGWKIEKSVREEAKGLVLVDLRLARATPAAPPRFKLKWEIPQRDTAYLWTPSQLRDGCRLQPTWGASFASELTRDMPLFALIGGGDANRQTAVASEAARPVRFKSGVVEETCALRSFFEFFSKGEAPIASYAVQVRIDLRARPWYESARDAALWLTERTGGAAKPPAAAFEPVYSTWYNFHQRLKAETIERECALAAGYGMKTLIVDDGWQTDDVSRGYAYCGDWQVSANRFPDMAGHVRRVHALGLKYVMWYAVPYVGFKSANYARFEGKYLAKRERHATAVLDPRFPEVRDFLAGTYERAVREWDVDGFKLDFIDAFATGDGPDPAERDNYAGRDVKTIPEGVERLLAEVVRRVTALKPDALFEFRQNYYGPVVRRYGNMVRANDCPADAASNRMRTLNLRLVCPGTAVHSDMLEWNGGETPEAAARQILAVLFSTVQYSRTLATMREDHGRMLRHWTDFLARHRATLLGGELRPHHPEEGYPLVEAESAEERIVAAYAGGRVLPVAADKPTVLVNATDEAALVADVPADMTVETFDVYGVSQGSRRLAKGLARVAVPPSGTAMCRPDRPLATGSDYRLYNVVPMYIGHEREQAARCVDFYERTGSDLALYTLTLHPEGRPAIAKADRYIASYRAFAAALKGTKVRPGILVQAILGHWPRTDKDIEPWERTIDQKGKIVRFCPLDPGFAAYIDEVFRKLASAHPAFILTDDDVRAYSHGCECFCKTHVRLFNERRGTAHDSDSLRAAIAASKPGEADYDTFFALQREMMEEAVVGRIRRAIDSVDPSIPAGVCVSGEEHWMCLPLARKIAAKGQTPVLRCSTGKYGERMTANGFPQNYLRMLGFTETYGRSGAELLDEADTCPQNLWSKSARSFFTHLVASDFAGMRGAKTWYVNGLRATGQPVSLAYTDVLAENRGLLDSLARAARGAVPAGLALPVFTKPHEWHMIHHHGEFFLHGWAVAKAIIPYGLPVTASSDFGNRDLVFVLSVPDEAERLTDAELERLFSGRVLVLREAARALVARGRADLLGVTAVATAAMYNAEHDRATGANLIFTSTMDTYGTNVVLKAVADVETLSELTYSPFPGAKGEPVAPASVLYTNRLGGRVVTSCWHDGMMSLHQYSEERRRWLVACLDRLSDAPMAYCDNEQDVLLSERRAPDGTRLFLAVNLNSDPIRLLRIRLAGTPRLERLMPDGSWQALAATRDGACLVLDLPLGFYEATVLRSSGK